MCKELMVCVWGGGGGGGGVYMYVLWALALLLTITLSGGKRASLGEAVSTHALLLFLWWCLWALLQ